MKFQKRKVPTSGGGQTNFLKINDGESKSGICRGDIYEFHVKWVSGKSVVVASTDPEAKTRFRLNFIVYDEGKFKALIWEFGIMIYNQLADINEEYPLEKTKIKISRSGTGTDTEYRLLPLLKEPLSDVVMKAIEAVPLNILDKALDPKKVVPSAPSWDDSPMPDESDLPF